MDGGARDYDPPVSTLGPTPPPGGPQPRPEPDEAPGGERPTWPYDAGAASVARADTSRRMATLSLVLSLLFFVPFAPLVGLVLGIVVLVRARGSHDHGKGRAIAATVIGTLYLLSLVGAVALGVVQAWNGPAAERDDDGAVTESSEVDIANLEEGDCVLRMQHVEDLEPGEAATGLVAAVPCAEPHLAEVFLIYEIDPDGYPDQETLDRAALDGCLPAFADYVGRSFERSRLDLNYYNPSKEGRFGDDRVICLVTSSDGLTSEMLADSRR